MAFSHPTDYQPAEAFAALVADGFAIRKVGPWLHGLDRIAQILEPGPEEESLIAVMKRTMEREPRYWRDYCRGRRRGGGRRGARRHFGYSDRIRYYWRHPAARTLP